MSTAFKDTAVKNAARNNIARGAEAAARAGAAFVKIGFAGNARAAATRRRGAWPRRPQPSQAALILVAFTPLQRAAPAHLRLGG